VTINHLGERDGGGGRKILLSICLAWPEDASEETCLKISPAFAGG